MLKTAFNRSKKGEVLSGMKKNHFTDSGVVLVFSLSVSRGRKREDLETRLVWTVDSRHWNDRAFEQFDCCSDAKKKKEKERKKKKKKGSNCKLLKVFYVKLTLVFLAFIHLFSYFSFLFLGYFRFDPPTRGNYNRQSSVSFFLLCTKKIIIWIY